jgi:hypothetical protein
MGIEYRLGTRESGTLELSCKNAKAIVKNMGIHGFGDCISFEKINTDGSTLGSHWGIHSLGCFEEMSSAYHGRLIEMPEQAVRKLAVRMYELLYTQHIRSPLYHKTPPEINKKDPRFRQILEELTALQAKEKKLANSGKLLFPQISQKELASIDSW